MLCSLPMAVAVAQFVCKSFLLRNIMGASGAGRWPRSGPKQNSTHAQEREAALCYCFARKLPNNIYPYPVSPCPPAAAPPAPSPSVTTTLTIRTSPQVHRQFIACPNISFGASRHSVSCLRLFQLASLVEAPLSLSPPWLHYSLTNTPTSTTPQCSRASLLPPSMPLSTTQPVPIFSHSCPTSTFHLRPPCWHIGCTPSSSISSTLSNSLILRSAEYMTRLKCLRGTKSQ